LKPYFLDTSVIVKRYLTFEPGAGWVQALFDPLAMNVIFLASMTVAEVASALSKRVRIGDITAADGASFAAAFGGSASDYAWVLVDPLVNQAASLALTHGLRAYDAVQLAAALEARKSLDPGQASDFTFLSADTHLLTAAAAEGLRTDDPNRH